MLFINLNENQTKINCGTLRSCSFITLSLFSLSDDGNEFLCLVDTVICSVNFKCAPPHLMATRMLVLHGNVFAVTRWFWWWGRWSTFILEAWIPCFDNVVCRVHDRGRRYRRNSRQRFVRVLARVSRGVTGTRFSAVTFVRR